MCGIAGILTSRDDLAISPLLENMLAGLRHRGPDDEGCMEARLPNGYRLGLVHSRLSILDLSPHGHQPMNEAESGSWVSYNGEIYNHKEVRRGLGDAEYHSSGDTETLLRGWVLRGPSLLTSLRGMFAFALYDGRRQELWLVRDRLGIKPLYVAQVDSRTWVFASEVRTILASGFVASRLSPAAVESYLAFGAVSAPWTLIEGVRCLLPGECWRFDLWRPTDELTPQRIRYWRPPFLRESSSMRYEEGVERLQPVLLESMSLHMLSDVPVGVFLSGGIDSSSIVAALSHEGHKLHTFSVLFGERAFDESPYARLIAEQYGTEHTELEMPPEKVLAHMEAGIASYDQPSIDGLNTYFISRAVHDAGIKVAMSGLGGDELFAGYANFRRAALLDRPFYRGLARAVFPLLRTFAPGSARAEKLGAILHGSGSRLENYAIFRQVMMSPRRHGLLARAAPCGPFALPAEIVSELEHTVATLDALNAYSLLELSLYMANMLLRDADQMSMVHPVEVRVPLLDHVLVEELACLPGRLKVMHSHHSPQKQLLLDALPTPLPSVVLNRRKMGFVFPWEIWLRGELSGLVSDAFADTETLRATGLNPRGVTELWNGFRQRRPGIRYTDILSLVHLVHWARQWNLSLAA